MLRSGRAAVRTVVMAGLVAVVSILSLALPATADAPAYPPGPGPTIVVKQPTPPTPPAKVAFTGTNVFRWVLLATALAVVGSLLLVVARRKGRVPEEVNA